MQIPLIALEIEEHEDEQIEDENRAGVDDDLDGEQKLRVEEHEEAGHMQQQRQQGNPAMDGIPQGDGENPRHDAHH